MMIVLERFDEIVFDAEEEAMRGMQEVKLPSEAETKLRETMLAWRSPEERPSNGAPLFKQAKELISKLRLEHEQVLIARLPIVNNQEAYEAMIAEVEREFVGARTILRGQLRAGRNQHRAVQEDEMSTMYGWPPAGPGPSLKRAGRKYIRELGADHPTVEDFIAAVRRHIKAKEDRCILEMTPLEKDILRLRALVNAVPAAPKLMREAYIEEMNEKCLEAMNQLSRWEGDLGKDSPSYLRFMKSTLGTEKFIEKCEAEAAEVADDIRTLGPRPPPSLEEDHVTECRALYAISLAFLLETLEAHVQLPLPRKEQVAALRTEFASELKRVEEEVALFKNLVDEDEGWHKPPSYSNVEQKMKPPEPPPPPPPKKRIVLERELPGMKEGTGLTMRLHGVGGEDVMRHNEILLLEMCGDIIAEECKIPRDCIFNLSFSDPVKVAAEKAAAEKAAAEQAAAEAAAAEAAAAEKAAAEAAAEEARKAEVAPEGYAALKNPRLAGK
jgi:hypothetical protein